MEMKVEKTEVMRIWRQSAAMKIMIDQKQLENVEQLTYLSVRHWSLPNQDETNNSLPLVTT
jgi:hypothetical protein